MQPWRRFLTGKRFRDAVVVLTAFSYLLIALGLPLPASARNAPKDSDIPYACQNRPCGCQSSQECWKGDCCCFTLEQKIAWANENNITPPEHAVRLAEARALKAHDGTKHGSCCDAADHQATRSCCDAHHHEDADDDHDDAATASCCHEQKAPRSVAKIVIGIFALQCHGEVANGLAALPLAVPPVVKVVRLDSLPCVGAIQQERFATVCMSILLATPPPRSV